MKKLPLDFSVLCTLLFFHPSLLQWRIEAAESPKRTLVQETRAKFSSTKCPKEATAHTAHAMGQLTSDSFTPDKQKWQCLENKEPPPPQPVSGLCLCLVVAISFTSCDTHTLIGTGTAQTPWEQLSQPCRVLCLGLLKWVWQSLLGNSAERGTSLPKITEQTHGFTSLHLLMP